MGIPALYSCVYFKAYSGLIFCQEYQKVWCLFNIKSDPCEYNNVAKDNIPVVEALVKRFVEFQATAVDGGVFAGEGEGPVRVPISTSGHAWQPFDMGEVVLRGV